MNYRFTFQTGSGNVSYTIYVPLNYKDFISSANLTVKPLVGGFSPIFPNSTIYQKSYNSIIFLYPWAITLNFVNASMQVVSGYNVNITLRDQLNG